MTLRAASVARVLLSVLALALPACGQRFEGGGDLRAQRVVLEREVEGLRAIVSRLERGEPMLPPDDIAIAIEDALLRDLIAAQLPFEADVDRFHLSLTEVETRFRGSPVVRLRGALNARETPELAAAVNVIGALENIAIDPGSSTLRAGIAVDHIGIEKAAGIESWLSGPVMDEAARLVRLQLGGRLPPVQIPVKLQQSIDLPAVTTGPVRIDGATMPLQVTVSQVVAGQGRLWVSVHLQPGDLVDGPKAPEAVDSSAGEADVGFAEDDEAGAGKPGARGQEK